MTALHVDRITSVEDLAVLRPEWARLETASQTDLPFHTWEWAISWWTHLREAGLSARDSLAVRVVRGPSGELVAVAPLMLTQRPGSGPIRIRFLQFFGADPNISELRGVLCRPGLERQAYQALVDELRASSDEWDWIEWTGLSAEGLRVLDAAGRIQRLGARSAFVLTLAPTWVEFKQGLGRNVKESIRKCYKSLSRDGLAASFAVCERPEAIGPALESLFRLHRARAGLADTVPHKDVFATARARSFMRSASSALAERGATRIFELRVHGAIVATRVGFALGDTLYLYYSGWDPAYRRYSVMTTLLVETLQYAIEHGFRHVNLSTGNDVAKTRWGPREVVYRQGLQVAPRWRSRGARACYAWLLQVCSHPRAHRLAPRFLMRGDRACRVLARPAADKCPLA